MKILIVTNMYPSPKMPTYGIFVKEQLDALKRYHPDVIFKVYSIDGGGISGAGKWKSLKNYFKSITAVDAILRKESFDLIHVHYGFSGLFLLNPFRKRIPTLVTLHGGDIQPEQKMGIQVLLTKKILHCADYAITLNERMDGLVQKCIPKTSIIPCAIDANLFIPQNTITHKNKIPIIVFPSDKSRFVKNYPLFAQTIELLKSKYGIECETREVKKMSRIEVRNLYQSADLMLMTSVSEGSPQVVKEAMACNLPVVSTPVGDVNLLLRGVKDSAVSEKHDATELAHLCFRSLKHKIEGINGRKRIYQLGLDDESVSDKIYTIYNTLISQS